MLPHRIPRIRSSKWPALAQIINQLAENQEALQVAPGRNIRARAGALGFAFDLPLSPEQLEARGIFRFKVTGPIHPDYLECNKWDGQTLGEAVNVAKPWFLRETYFDETFDYTDSQHRTITRIAPDNVTEVSAEEVVTPVYTVGQSEILAAEPEGGTRLHDVDGDEITWEDINNDARHWDLGFQVVQVCMLQGGALKRFWMIVRGGAPVLAAGQ